MSREHSSNPILDQIRKYHGRDKFELITEFIGAIKPITVKCLDCGHIQEFRQARRIYEGGVCKGCKTKEYAINIEESIKNKHPHINLLESYVNSRTTVRYQCTRCDTVGTKLPRGILKCAEPCTACYRPHQSITQEDFIQKVKTIHGSNYTVTGQYINNDEDIAVTCNMCRTDRKIKASSLLLGNKCQECERQSRTYTQQYLLDKIREMYNGDEYVALTQFKNMTTQITFKHLKCGNTFSTTPKLLLNGTRCSYCTSMSAGAKVVHDYLKENKIPTILEATHEGLRSPETNYKLRMDFLCKISESLVNIEYHGKQHYYTTGFSRDLYTTRMLDRVKLDFCSDNGIYQLVVPYVIPLEDIHSYLKYALGNPRDGFTELVPLADLDRLVYKSDRCENWYEELSTEQ